MPKILRRALAGLALTFALAGLAAAPLAAQESGASSGSGQANRPDPADVFDARERAALQATIEQYLLDNPEILEKMVARLEKRQAQQGGGQGEAGGAEAIAAHRDALLNKAGDPVGGNPDGDVTIVEFFDYNCSYCRKLAPRLADLVATDGDVRVVYKEYPILAKSSATAARAALAVQERAPAKYEAFHTALMQSSAKPTPERLGELAAEHGLDAAAIKDAATSKSYDARLQANIDLAGALGISGTPAMVIGDQVITGAVPRQRIAEAVEQARADEES